MYGYLRTPLKEFHSLEKLNKQFDFTMKDFIKHLKDIKNL